MTGPLGTAYARPLGTAYARPGGASGTARPRAYRVRA